MSGDGRDVRLGPATRPRPWSPVGSSSHPVSVSHQLPSALAKLPGQQDLSDVHSVETFNMAEYSQRLQTNEPIIHDHNHDHSNSEHPQFRPLSRPPSFQSYPQSPRPPPRLTPSFSDYSTSPRPDPTSHFPRFARGWFSKPPASSATRSFTQHLIHSDATSTLVSQQRPYDSYDDSEPKVILPWNAPLGPIHSEPQLPLAVKEERIRMLEDEFGTSPDVGKDREAATHFGGLDVNGHLLIHGKRKRKAIRLTQGFLSLSATISSLYAALAIHPNPAAPPAGKVPAYLLYLISTATVMYMLYMLVIRPCCCGGRRHRLDPSMDPYSHLASVLPTHTKGNKSKNKKGPHQQPVNVNIIVDPRLFSSHSRPDSDSLSPSHPSATVTPSPFATIALETEWLRARKELKIILAVDILLCLLWLIVFFAAVLGARCPPGGFQGWCNGYNTGIACAFLSSLAWLFSIVFDFRDFSTSRVSPRAAASPFRRS